MNSIVGKSHYQVTVFEYASSLLPSVEERRFIDYSQLEGENRVMDLSSFSQLKSFECGDERFNSVSRFIIDGLGQLESIQIGVNSFTLAKNTYNKKLNREFHLRNCSSLTELSIGRYSFSYYLVM